MHLITHWEGGNLCIVIKYSSERMAEAGLCGWLPGDDGGKSLEVQEDRRRRRRKKKWCLLCKSHKPVGRFNAKAAQSLFFFPPGILHRSQRCGPKVFNEGVLSLGLLINGKHLVNELIE